MSLLKSLKSKLGKKISDIKKDSQSEKLKVSKENKQSSQEKDSAKPSQKTIKKESTKQKSEKINKNDEKKKQVITPSEDKKKKQSPIQKEQKHGKAAKYYTILHKPHITEKTTGLTKQDAYVFKVPLNVNKTEVFSAINAIFQIKPVSVRMIKQRGKRVRVAKISGKRKDFKKAIVTLPKGKKLDIFEGV